MPELPEVETIARHLRPRLTGRTIEGAVVLWPRTLVEPDASLFPSAIVGARITGADRRGKYLLMPLADGRVLISHLRMSGRWIVTPPSDEPPDRHVRVLFHLNHGDRLSFVDPRKFGRMALVADPSAYLGYLGPEPLSPAVTVERLADLLRGRRRRIKSLLLDQRVLAGLGNIYTDEALWRAAIHPLRHADSLTEEEVRRLHEAIRVVLQDALEHLGTSLHGGQYRLPDNRTGRHQDYLKVYRRAGGPCLRCGTAIQRIVVEQRGTYICPRCQQIHRVS